MLKIVPQDHEIVFQTENLINTNIIIIILGTSKPFGRHRSRTSIRITIFILKTIIRSGCLAVGIVEIIIAEHDSINCH